MSESTIDTEELLVLHAGGLRTTVIAAFLGVHRSTVSRHLKALGLTTSPARAETCARGHTMADAYPVAGGGRGCRTCKRVRDAAWARARYWQQKTANVGGEE